MKPDERGSKHGRPEDNLTRTKARDQTSTGGTAGRAPDVARGSDEQAPVGRLIAQKEPA
jgi:hypothetical protein